MTTFTNSSLFCSLHIILFFCIQKSENQVHWQKSVDLLLFYYYSFVLNVLISAIETALMFIMFSIGSLSLYVATLKGLFVPTQ